MIYPPPHLVFTCHFQEPKRAHAIAFENKGGGTAGGNVLGRKRLRIDPKDTDAGCRARYNRHRARVVLGSVAPQVGRGDGDVKVFVGGESRLWNRSGEHCGRPAVDLDRERVGDVWHARRASLSGHIP